MVSPMPALINYALIACLAIALLFAVLDHVRRPSWHRFLIYVLGLGAIAVALFLTTGFPFPSARRAFGAPSSGQSSAEVSQLLALALMFVGVVLGIAATYVFNLAGAFSWRDLARPLVVSPLVLLPLIGSLQGANLEPVQLVCFTVLAFQNGFFWQQVLRDAKPSK
jgi:hypothetical protein